jgi:hypothetical protein
MKSSSVVNSGGDRYKVLETTNGKELSDTSYLEGLRINKKPTKKDISISTINIDGLFDNIDVSFNRLIRNATLERSPFILKSKLSENGWQRKILTLLPDAERERNKKTPKRKQIFELI